ncbi:MAG TPA: hypothetical protein VHC70_14295, partial [Phycisphaerales bacterium]|nr:hypothetical protein [Phycisphaerales bacterium]
MRCTNSLLKRGASVLAAGMMLLPSVCRADDPAADVLSGPDQMPERTAATQGMLTFGGPQWAGGFLDYSKPIVPTADALNQLPWVILGAGAGESPRDLRGYQTRGQRVELNWGLLDSLDNDLPFRAVMPLFDGERREMVFIRPE